MLAHPSIDGEFTSVDDPGSVSISARADQSPKDGIAKAAVVSATRLIAAVALSNAFEVMVIVTRLRLKGGQIALRTSSR
jgi:hypothetical protein